MKPSTLEPKDPPLSVPGEGDGPLGARLETVAEPLPKIYYRHWVHVPVRLVHEYRLEGPTKRLDELVRKSRWLWSYSCEGRAVIIAERPEHFARFREVRWRLINWTAPDYPGRPGVDRGVWRAWCAWETTKGGKLRRRRRVVVSVDLLTRDEWRLVEWARAGDKGALERLHEAIGRVDLEVEGIRYRVLDVSGKLRLQRMRVKF